MATETVKIIAGIGEPLVGRLLSYEALGMHMDEVPLERNPDCPMCGDQPKIFDLSHHAEGLGVACVYR